MKNKRLSFTVLVLWFTLSLSAQISLKLSHVKTVEDFGIIYNSGWGIELERSIGQSFNDKLNFIVGGGLLSSTPQLDNYPGYAIGAKSFIGGTPQTNVIPTNATYGNLFIIPIGLTGNYRFLNRPFSPYFRFGMLYNLALYEITTEGGLINGTRNVELATMAAKSGIGFSYLVNEKIEIQLGLTKTVSFISNDLPIKYWQNYLSATYLW